MKVYNSAIANTPIQKTNSHLTSFKSSFRSVYRDTFVLKYNTNTCFFRNDLNWAEFVDMLKQTYSDADKVNIINYACSTGEEPISLMLMLDTKLGKEAKKFYPIKAYDIDSENIKRANNGVFDITKDELELLRQNTGDEFKKYFISHIDKNEMQGKLRLKHEYKHNVVYNESDILKDIKKIPKRNTVLMCRNFLPYLQIGEQKKLVKQLSKKLDSTSMVVLGKFEIDYGIEKLFEKEGFVHTSQYNVMKKLPFFKALLTKLKYGLKLR